MWLVRNREGGNDMFESAIGRTALLPILGFLAGTLSLGLQQGRAAAEEPASVVQGEFVPSDALKSVKAMTFVLDFAPGLSVPLHSHPIRSQVLVIDGEVTFQDLSGKDMVVRKGEVLTMEADQVLAPRNAGKENARLVWTIVLPDGVPLEVMYQQ
jgi:quercetin dioxygenase-like cupin family protein